MAFCTNCGKKLDTNDKYCSGCGAVNTEYRTEVESREANLDVTIETKIRLKGTKNEKTECPIFIPHLNREIYVNVPNIVEEGYSIRLVNKGLTGHNGERGNLIIKLNTVEYFDTEMTISVELSSEANDSTEVPLYIPHMKKTVQITVPNNMTTEKILRIKGLGLETPEGVRGDLYLHFDRIGYKQSDDNNGTVEELGKDGRDIRYDGKVYKCPLCGEIINSFVPICPSCGYEIRGISNSDAVQGFAKKLDLVRTTQEKVSIIRNFPIPNTKEDILEFMILAASNISDNLERDISDAWISKAEQAYQKAQIIFPNDKEFIRVQNIYIQVGTKLTSQKKKEKIQNAGAMLAELMPVLPNVFVVVGWLISIFALLPFCKINLDVVGTNGAQLILMLDFIAGVILIPFAFKCPSHLPKLIASLGLILSVVVLIPLCGKNLDDTGTNAFQLILIVDIICSIIIFVRMFELKQKSENSKTALNVASFMIAFICMMIMLVVYGIGSITTAISVRTDNAIKDQEMQEAQSVTYEWPSVGLSRYLPLPEIEYGKIKTDDEIRFNIEVYQVSQEVFDKYTKECMEKGFTIETTKTDSVFYAYHAEQYELSIFYWEDKETMDIFVDAPLAMSEISWPDNKLVKQIPKPESLIGKIVWENTEHFDVHIANTTPEQYREYVDQCMEAGFTVDYSRGEKTFYAHNKKGYYLVVEQHLFDTIYISIKAPEKK